MEQNKRKMHSVEIGVIFPPAKLRYKSPVLVWKINVPTQTLQG